MPRAYYRPFTTYEEIFGFHTVRRNAYFFCAFLFSALLFKIAIFFRYSPSSSFSTADIENNPDYHRMMDKRLEMVETLSSQENMRMALKRRLQAPPA
ncbi:unnamed protein product [Phytomonas sp. Hart1]|nr:unnamed protein product [Phytomonas sp. Hart1]|eukprot:CCW69034.1 unnamed protein product [Phytomonas sp. isolate Hart1]